jgi:6-phosphogluconate dehydrogenase
MVHNGIEYGIMQVISESYALMKLALGLSNERLAEIYAQWNAAELESYLVEITAEIFRRRDGETAGFLIDLIKGEAEQLGTGMWASQSAMDLHVPVPGIDIAVAMRNVSGTERPPVDTPPGKSGTGVTEGGAPTTTAGLTPEHVRRALHAAVILTYVQGFAQLSAASAAYGFGLKLAEVATVWRGGCIIRSGLLRDFKTAFEGRGESADLRLDPRLSDEVRSRRSDLVRTVEAGMSDRIPVPGLMAALGYLDAYSAEWLPTNLIQAQRDYFGAHTYRRLDRDGVFHTDWSDSGPPADGGTRAADAPAATAGS